MGLPLHGVMQTATFYPATAAFAFFSFATALKIHWLLHHALAALWSYLWLRRFTGRAAATAGAAVFASSGILIVRVTNLGMHGTLAWWPSFFLFADSAPLLGLAMANALVAGYPQMWAGMATSIVLPWVWTRKDAWRRWVAGIGIALVLCTAMLLPGLELAFRSNRREGLSVEQRTLESVRPSEFAGFVSPLLGARSQTQTGSPFPFWKTFYIGMLACLAASFGLASLRIRTRIWTAGLGATMAFLMLGRENPLSLAFWKYLPPLWFIRYPANFSYLLLGIAVPLVAIALRGKRWAPVAAGAICAELVVWGYPLNPSIRDSFFGERGPLAAWLQENLEGHRYALSPLAALHQRGSGPTLEAAAWNVKRRLYGLSNLPYHLPGTTALGEALMIAKSYEVMDFLFSRPKAEEAMKYFPWLDVKYLLTRDRQRSLGPPAAEILWPIYQTRNPARAWWIRAAEEGKIEGGFERAPEISQPVPLQYEQLREDRFRVTGKAPAEGWVVVSNPCFPGWRAYETGVGGQGPVQVLPAITAFQAVKVPPGPMRLVWIYRPASFYMGTWISIAGLLSLVGMALRAPSIKSWLR